MDQNTKEEKIIDPPVNVNVEIDYDKLATAIVKAQEMANDESEDETDKSIPIWKKILGLFIPIQKQRKEKMTVRFFSFVVGGLCWLLGLSGIIFFIPAIILSFEYVIDFVLMGDNLFWQIYNGFLVFVFLILSLTLLILLTGMGTEIMNSDDKHFVVAVFSAITSLIALVIALIALFK